MCHISQLTDEQLALFYSLPRDTRGLIERTLDAETSPRDTKKVRATFEGFLKRAGIDMPFADKDARDLARETYSAARIAAIIA